MKNIKKRFAVFVGGILAAFLLPLEVALAAPSNEMGCITRDPDTAKLKFLRNDLPDKKAIGEAAVNTYRSLGIKVIDFCLIGKVRNIPASIYIKLAEKYPEKFQSIENDTQDIAASTKTKTGAVLGLAPQYRYIELDETVPSGFLFDSFSTIGITNNNRVYSSVFNELEESPYVAVFEHDSMIILEKSKGIYSTAISGSGKIGGAVITDIENFIVQPALFDGNEIQIIPQIPGSIYGFVSTINDLEQAVIASIILVGEDAFWALHFYDKGEVTHLDFGPNIPPAFPSGMNNQGIISGTTFIDGLGYRGFRINPRTNETMLLEPLPTEPHAWALDINNRGNILGYSFEFGATERIGVWDEQGKFHTYFVEGIPEFPTISNDLVFNDNNQIVITQVSSPLNEQGNSYLVPKPGTRLNLDDLVMETPSPLINDSNFWRILGISNHGNMFGRNFYGGNPAVAFLLERIGDGDK